jgi:hypothetical protein
VNAFFNCSRSLKYQSIGCSYENTHHFHFSDNCFKSSKPFNAVGRIFQAFVHFSLMICSSHSMRLSKISFEFSMYKAWTFQEICCRKGQILTQCIINGNVLQVVTQKTKTTYLYIYIYVL